jgi:predicted transcriptional regulator
MDVPINPDLQAKLRCLAEQQGRASTALIVEAVERMVNYDEWFLRVVDKGLPRPTVASLWITPTLGT